ncbi:MAG: thioredoxin domain-containing protein [Candidatus Wallbacteria bacterium]|nr:thioredoxin domain-containing protein [Candidatus Wallbacteria bacterium]
MNKLLGILIVLALILPATAKESHPSNMVEISYGLETDWHPYAEPGKINIIDFFSPYCPPCMQYAPLLLEMAKSRSDVKIIKININREGIQGIDWKSPVAAQYGLKSVPRFIYVDQNGAVCEDDQAREKLDAMLEPYQYVVFDLALKKNPNDTRTLYNRALYCMKRQEYGQAIADLETIIETSEQQFEAVHYNLACCHALAGNIELALDALEKSLDMASKNPESGLPEHFKKDSDLRPLYGASRFKALVGKDNRRKVMEAFEEAQK